METLRDFEGTMVFVSHDRSFLSALSNRVLELTDDMNLPYMERKWLQVEKAHLLTEKARKIRLVDKATNIRDILTYPLNWPLEKKEAYLENAIQVVGRIRGGNPRLDDWFDQTVEWARERLTELGAAPPK